MIQGGVLKKLDLEKNALLPARDASSFWLEKKWWPNVVGMPRPTGPLIGKGVPEPIFDRQGRFLFMPQIGASFEIHEFINCGWPKWCPRGSPRKRSFLKKKCNFACTGRMFILLIFLVGVHRWNSEGAASRLFRGGARPG